MVTNSNIKVEADLESFTKNAVGNPGNKFGIGRKVDMPELLMARREDFLVAGVSGRSKDKLKISKLFFSDFFDKLETDSCSELLIGAFDEKAIYPLGMLLVKGIFFVGAKRGQIIAFDSFSKDFLL